MLAGTSPEPRFSYAPHKPVEASNATSNASSFADRDGHARVSRWPSPQTSKRETRDTWCACPAKLGSHACVQYDFTK